MTQLSDAIAKLQSDVAALTSAEQAAVALLNGIAAQLAQALVDLQNAGVPADQLQALSDLSSAIETQTADLAAAVTVNTPASPAPVA